MGTDAAPLSHRDVLALLTVVAVVGSATHTGDLPLDMSLRIRRRLITDGVLPREAPLSAVTDVLETLSQPLHHLASAAAGAATRPAATPLAELPVENPFAFGDEGAAATFAETMRRAGKEVDTPVHESKLGRWTVVVHGQRKPDGQVHDEIGLEAEAALTLGGWHLGVG